MKAFNNAKRRLRSKEEKNELEAKAKALELLKKYNDSIYAAEAIERNSFSSNGNDDSHDTNNINMYETDNNMPVLSSYSKLKQQQQHHQQQLGLPNQESPKLKSPNLVAPKPEHDSLFNPFANIDIINQILNGDYPMPSNTVGIVPIDTTTITTDNDNGADTVSVSVDTIAAERHSKGNNDGNSVNNSTNSTITNIKSRDNPLTSNNSGSGSGSGTNTAASIPTSQNITHASSANKKYESGSNSSENITAITASEGVESNDYILTLRRKAEDAQKEALLALEEGQKNLAALEQACSVIDYFQNQINHIKQENLTLKAIALTKINGNDAVAVTGSSFSPLPLLSKSNASRIASNLLSAPPILQSGSRQTIAAYSTVKAVTVNKAAIENELRLNKNGVRKTLASLQHVYNTTTEADIDAESSSNSASNGNSNSLNSNSNSNWLLLDVYHTFKEAQVARTFAITDNDARTKRTMVSSSIQKKFEDIQIRFDMKTRKWVLEGLLVKKNLKPIKSTASKAVKSIGDIPSSSSSNSSCSSSRGRSKYIDIKTNSGSTGRSRNRSVSSSASGRSSVSLSSKNSVGSRKDLSEKTAASKRIASGLKRSDYSQVLIRSSTYKQPRNLKSWKRINLSSSITPAISYPVLKKVTKKEKMIKKRISSYRNDNIYANATDATLDSLISSFSSLNSRYK